VIGIEIKKLTIRRASSVAKRVQLGFISDQVTPTLYNIYSPIRIHGIFFPASCSTLWSIGLISQFLDHFTDGRTAWTGDQLVARSLPKHRTTQTQNKRIHTPNIHALCGIGTHDPGFRASEDSAYLRPLGYRDWPYTA
jgi:hypothetical protein